MERASGEDEMFHLTMQITNLFSNTNTDTSNKWSLLKEYHSKYLENCSAPTLINSSYHTVTSTLLDALKPTLFNEKMQEKQFDDIFLHGIHHESFTILVRKLDACCESYQKLKIINLLMKFLQGKSLLALILQQCLSQGKYDPEYIAASNIWNDLIILIVSLPERVANKTKGIMPKIFQVEYYLPLLTSSILKTLSTVHAKIVNCQDCTLEFIGKLVGKLCALGYAEIITQRLSLTLVRHSGDDLVWRRISQNLISKMPFSSLEPFVTHLLLSIPWYGYVEWILGDEGAKIQRLIYILTTKLILVRHFKKPTILQNIIGYYAVDNNRQKHFWDILSSLLQTWSDHSALKHQSSEQQKFLASGLVICAGWLNKLKDNKFQGEAYMDKALHGIQIRIGNSEKFTRDLGMVAGGLLLSTLKSDVPKLQYEDTVEEEFISEFNELFSVPNDPDKDFLHSDELSCFAELKSENNLKLSDTMEKDITKDLDTKLLLNCDDDLEAYDMSGDISQECLKRPYYLNDCLQGLIEQESADWFEQCLKHAESIIEANSDIVFEIAVEMSKVVLHLEDKFSIQGFNDLKLKILVSLAVHSPILVSEYLTSQFYEKEYNIKQRLDILETLEHASKILSTPSKDVPLMPEKFPIKEKFNASLEKTWKSIVDERVASKTRYITKTPKQSLAESHNRFSAVAGYFFYPLLAKYDKSNPMLKLFGEDSYVLGRLIYTLGSIMRSAANIPSSKGMGEALLEFLVDVRNHTDVFVRQVSIFATVAVFSSVPGYLLFTDDIVKHVDDSKQWLQKIIEEDPDTNCQLKASYALHSLIAIINQEVPQIQGLLNTLK